MYLYYLATMTEITVDGTKMDVSGSDLYGDYGGAIIDSGTTLMYLPTKACEAIEAAVDSYLQSTGSSYTPTSAFFAQEEPLQDSSFASDFPKITIALDGYTLELDYSSYLFQYDNEYYWGIGESEIVIIGDVALDGLVVAYDQTDNTIGFATADCSISRSNSTTDDDSTSMFMAAEEYEARHPQQQHTQLKMAGGMAASAGLIAVGLAFAAKRNAGRREEIRYAPIS